jgi:hypothetical protein
MIGNFASLHAYIATVAFAKASSAPSEAPSAHLPVNDAVPVRAPKATGIKARRSSVHSSAPVARMRRGLASMHRRCETANGSGR